MEMIGVWKEMSFRKYNNSWGEKINPNEFEIENNNVNYIYDNYNTLDEYYRDCDININIIYYGSYEDIYKDYTFGVEDIFYLNYEE